jgi:hypothetical protein
MASIRLAQINEALEERFRQIERFTIDLDGTGDIVIGDPETRRLAKLRPGETFGQALLRLSAQREDRTWQKWRSSF